MGKSVRQIQGSHMLAMASAASLAVILTAPARAQTQDGTASDEINEIIVTAQKRSENIQDVPISITALNSEMLHNRGVDDPQALQYVTPGLQFADNPTGVGVVTLRGVGGSGSRGTMPGQNPAVPVHANGVYLQSPSIMMQDFLDVDRVEVLRGPQGTLYGRNAVGGSINIISKRPTAEVEGEVGFEIGNFGLRRGHGVLSGPLVEGVRGRLAFSMEDRDGFVTNVSDLGDDQLLNSNYRNVRATVEADLGPTATLTVIGYLYENDGASHTVRPRSLPVGFGAPSLYENVPAGYRPASFDDNQKVSHDTRGEGKDKTSGMSAELAWDLGGVSLRAITGYFDMSKSNIGDSDGTDLPQVHSVSNYYQEYKSFSQELQLASRNESPLRWLLGGYYYSEDSRAAIINDASSPLNFVPFLVGVDAQFDVESLAAFGQVDFEVVEGLMLTAGGRYTHDSMSASRGLVFNAPIYSDVPSEDSWSKFTWKLGAKYEFAPSAMAYASYSRGYKAGGFNVSDAGPAFNPESVDAFEVGFKVDALDRLVRLNGAVFYYDYTDKQELSVDATGFTVIQNAGAATLYGGELELVTTPVIGLALDASVSYLHTEYDVFSSLDLENPAGGVQDLAGNRLTESPEWQFHVGGQYTAPLGDNAGSVMLRVDYSYTDDKFVRPFNLPTDRVRGYGMTSARIAFTSANERWTIEGYMENIEDKVVVTSFAATSPFAGNFHQEVFSNPRTYGVKIRHRF